MLEHKISPKQNYILKIHDFNTKKICFNMSPIS
jgi:hypothetical protein